MVLPRVHKFISNEKQRKETWVYHVYPDQLTLEPLWGEFTNVGHFWGEICAETADFEAK